MKKKCSCDNCESEVYRRTYCTTHYMRFKRHGDPLLITRRSPGEATAEVKLQQKRDEYRRNKGRYLERAKRWREENSDYYEIRKAEYFSREDIKERARQKTREWVKANPERKKQTDKEWRENNRPKARAFSSKRRASERNATPPWLTKEHLAQITEIYAEAERLTIETGITHHVDHIIPLRGKTVSGLHVPWNLRAIPAPENLSKGARLIDNIL